ncbi:hypothetical protein TrST_g6932 [Triparma strigata]|uniref:MYND-type domain-containing protein n=1 Tax=Triparma strigata TaxID=1606541 RepID=A0A9W7BI34_9STRA|nr:hypothetical protein TrST_g6932 [Triparma strigata]
MLTEQISDIVARKHLRASKAQVLAATEYARGKRVEMCKRQPPFTCTFCTFHNSTGGSVCSMCGHSNRATKAAPSPVGVHENSGDKDSDEGALQKLPPPPPRDVGPPSPPISDSKEWTCNVCTLINPPLTTTCTACDTSRVFLKSSSASETDLDVKCDVCGKKAVARCTGCGRATYCGQECQFKDWKEHKKVCGRPE